MAALHRGGHRYTRRRVGSQQRIDSIRADPRFRAVADRVRRTRAWLPISCGEVSYRRDQNDRKRKSERRGMGRNRTRDAPPRARGTPRIRCHQRRPGLIPRGMILQQAIPGRYSTAHDGAQEVELDPFDRTAMVAAESRIVSCEPRTPQRYGTRSKRSTGMTLYASIPGVTDAERASGTFLLWMRQADVAVMTRSARKVARRRSDGQ